MNRIFKPIIRIFSFPKKELIEIFRQPQLILTLVLGPFLIILLFGISFPEQNRSLRTTLVVSEQSPLMNEAESLTESIGGSIIYQGLETDKDVALAELALRQTDMVVVVPDNPLEKISNNEQAKLMIYHNEVDPFQSAYIESVGRIYTNEVNNRILTSLTREGRESLQENLIGTLSGSNESLPALDSVDSRVLVRPFIPEVSGLSEMKFTPVGFLTPAVIILLLQHLSVTFAALSIVRESRSGIMELFRVAPLTPFETLLSKYFSYLIFNILIAALLTALIVWGMGIPMLGQWADYSLALISVIVTSLGVGFLISLISNTEIQAVQYSMLFLLMSVFFSGFFLDLRLMWEPMKVLAWSLPATYGIKMLHDVMLRGYSIPLLVSLGLAAIGVVLFIVNYLLLRRKMTT